MNVSTENGDVLLRMTPDEAMDLASLLRTENHPLAYRLAVALPRGKSQQKRIQVMWRASNPAQDIPAHSAERDQRLESER